MKVKSDREYKKESTQTDYAVESLCKTAKSAKYVGHLSPKDT